MTARYLLQVSSRAVPGREEEYDRWYGDIHVGEVLALPGFDGCERYRQLTGDGRPTGESVAIYTVTTDDPAALLQSLFDATPTFRLTDAMDTASVQFTWLKPCAPEGGRAG